MNDIPRSQVWSGLVAWAERPVARFCIGMYYRPNENRSAVPIDGSLVYVTAASSIRRRQIRRRLVCSCRAIDGPARLDKVFRFLCVVYVRSLAEAMLPIEFETCAVALPIYLHSVPLLYRRNAERDTRSAVIDFTEPGIRDTGADLACRTIAS